MTSIDREHVCAFTGHRPEKLAIPVDNVIAWLDKEIQEAVDDGYTKFISGMQRGVDIWAAELVLKLRSEGRPIQLIAASAFRGMEKQWNQEWQDRYRKILASADEVHNISDLPGRQAFFARNHWIADRASRLLAVFTGMTGGTQEMIRYAETHELEIRSISLPISERRNEICS